MYTRVEEKNPLIKIIIDRLIDKLIEKGRKNMYNRNIIKNSKFVKTIKINYSR